MITPEAEVGAPTYYMGFCDVCRSVKTFMDARKRDLWETFHPHEEGE